MCHRSAALGASRPWLAEGARDGAELADEAVGVVRHRFELVMGVEVGGVVVDGVDHDELAAGPPRGPDDGVERDDQELAAEAQSVKIFGKRQFGEQDRRDVARCTTPGLLLQGVPLDAVRRDREVPHHLVLLVDHHIGARALAGRRAGMVMQPIVELDIAAPEVDQIVVVVELLDPVDHRVAIRR